MEQWDQGRQRVLLLCQVNKKLFTQTTVYVCKLYIFSGGYYEGQWANNKKQGQGKYTLPNGDVIEGIFHDDKFISQQKDSGFRPQTPLGSVIGDIDNEKNITEQFNLHVSVLLSDDSANTSVELKQVLSMINIIPNCCINRFNMSFYATLLSYAKYITFTVH